MSEFPNALWQLFDYQGKLAQYWGDTIGPNEPVRTVHIRVSGEPIETWEWINGKTPWQGGRSWASGVVAGRNGGNIFIASESWTEKDIRIEIPIPRDGKTYTWRWSSTSRKWIKCSFDVCIECRQQHHSERSHCSWCGKAIKLGTSGCRNCKWKGLAA